MAHPKSKESVERVKDYLVQMLNAKGGVASISWQTTDPSKLQRWIRDGIYASNYHEEFRHFGLLAQFYKLRVRDSNVIAEPRVKAPLTSIVEAELAGSFGVRTYREISTVEQVIGVLCLDKTKKAFFPSVVPPEDMMNLLYTWTSKNGYWIIDHEEDGVTLTQENPGELAWIPL